MPAGTTLLAGVEQVSERFLALDLAGAIHSVALCEMSSGMDVGAFGGLVRSRLLRVHAWLTAHGADTIVDQTCGQIHAAADLWEVEPADLLLVPLTGASAVAAVHIAAELGASRLWVPDDGCVISPRGIAPAVCVKDYAEQMPPPGKLDLPVIRDAFLPLMERAADDVQADGLEQDDAFFDRYAEVGSPGEDGSAILPLESLTDVDWLLRQWQAASIEPAIRAGGPEAIEIRALRLRCAVGTPDHGFRPGAARKPTPNLSVPAGWQAERHATGHTVSQVKLS